MSATVDTSELVALERRFGGVPGAVVRQSVPPMHRVVLGNERAAKQNARVDRGEFRQSITSTVEVTPTSVIGRWGSNKRHAKPNEFGRLPGKMPPKGVLVRSGWLRRHRIPDWAEFAVLRAIAKRGIKANPAIRRPHAELRARIAREFGGLARSIRAELVGR